MGDLGFLPVRKCDVAIGKPLPYSLYDGDRKLLLRAGCIVQTQNQLETLSQKGLYRSPSAASYERREAVGPDSDLDPERMREVSYALDEIKLAIGDPLQMQAAGEGESARYSARLVGYAKGKSIVVTTPLVGDKVAFIRAGQCFVVRMFCGTSAFAFSTSVIKSSSMPYPHLHLSYPSSVRGLAVRAGARARVRIIAAASDAKGKVHAGTLCDLSMGGAQMVSSARMGAVGDTVELKFRITLNDIEIYLHPAAVIRSIAAGDGSIDGVPPGFQHGLQFSAVPPDELLALTAVVYESLLRQSGDF